MVEQKTPIWLRRPKASSLLVATLVVAAAACASNSRKSTTITSLVIEPGDVTLQVTNDTPATQTYTVKAMYADGHTSDVTDKATWTLTPSSLGNFAGAQFTSNTENGGSGIATAVVGDQSGTTNIRIGFTKTLLITPTNVNLADLPANPDTLFGGAVDPARKPTIVYPNVDVLFPPNLSTLELHWLKGSNANTLFEVAFKNALTDVRAYVRCDPTGSVRADGCIWVLDSKTWFYIAETNRGADPLTVTIRATDDMGTAVGASDTQSMEFSNDNVNGTIYYWATTSPSSIKRHDFALSAKSAERVIPASVIQNSDDCVGCHTLSRDGKKIATSSFWLGSPDSRGYLLYDLAAKAAIINQTGNGANGSNPDNFAFGAFSPDGNQLVGVRMTGWETSAPYLYNVNCTPDNTSACAGSKLLSIGSSLLNHPAWSPDGARIAFTEAATLPGDPLSQRWAAEDISRPLYGRIVYTESTGPGWTMIKEWVPRVAGRNRFNPEFAPDSSFIVFNESICQGDQGQDFQSYAYSCDAYADPSARIQGVERGKNVPIAFTRINTKGVLDSNNSLQSTFPRFSPFTAKYKSNSADGNDILWMTFSSPRKYGLRKGPPAANGHLGTLIWMVGIRPSELKAGKDPSFPPFALPFQDTNTSNHIGQWTTEAVGDIAF